jgi:hypothetical protein
MGRGTSTIMIKPVILYIDNTESSFDKGFNSHNMERLKGVPLKVIRPKKYSHLPADIYLDDRHFESRESYSTMTTSSWFYEQFGEYSHCLFLYNDCWIFGDTRELEFWCKLDYSFIGAPHFKDFNYLKNPDELQHNMNGGLCLKNIRDCIDGFTYFERHYPHIKEKGHDDVFTSQLFRNLNFRMPQPLTAARFSWEQGAVKLGQLCKGYLPFGLHDPLQYKDQYPESILSLIRV